MQDFPDKAVLLEAVARFLAEVTKAKAPDPALLFRLRVAAHVAAAVAAEVRAEDEQDRAELERLERLVGSGEGGGTIPPPPSTRSERSSRTRGFNAEIARRIRAGTLSPDAQAAARAHVKETLAEKLRTNQPKFDLRLDIE